jgi:hypothetical protein
VLPNARDSGTSVSGVPKRYRTIETGSVNNSGGHRPGSLAENLGAAIGFLLVERPRFGVTAATAIAPPARSRFNDPIELMTLQSMRANGVRALAIQCDRTGESTEHSDRTFRQDAKKKKPRWTAGKLIGGPHAQTACSTDFWVGDELGAGLADLAFEQPLRPAHLAQSVLPRCHQFQPHWDAAFGARRRVGVRSRH